MLRGQNSVSATELFSKNGDVTRGKLSMQHVPATCPSYMSLVCASLKMYEDVTEGVNIMLLLICYLYEFFKPIENKIRLKKKLFLHEYQMVTTITYSTPLLKT